MKTRTRDALRKYRQGGQDSVRGLSITVKAWSKTFDQIHISKLKPRVQTEYRVSIRKWIIPTIGSRKTSQLTPGDIRAVADAILAADNSDSQAAGVDRVLRTMLRKAEKEGIHLPRAVLLTDRPEEIASDRNAIPVPATRRILAHAKTIESGDRWFFALLYALRQGECLGLLWDNIDFENNVIRIRWELQRVPYADKQAKTFVIPGKYESVQLYGGLHLIDVKTKAGYRDLPLLPEVAEMLHQW